MNRLGTFLGSVPVKDPPPESSFVAKRARVSVRARPQKIRKASQISPHQSDQPIADLPPRLMMADNQNNQKPIDEKALRQNANQIEYQMEAIARQIEQEQKRYPNESVVVANTGDNVKQILPVSELTREVYRIKAIFPFDLFPNEVILEEKRLIVNQRHFFLSYTLDTIPIASLQVFEVTRSILFAGLHIIGATTDVEIKWLWPHEAQKMKNLVDGMVMKEKGLVEVKEPDPQKRADVYEEIGEVSATV